MRFGGEYKWEIKRDRGFCWTCRLLNESGFVELNESECTDNGGDSEALMPRAAFMERSSNEDVSTSSSPFGCR